MTEGDGSGSASERVMIATTDGENWVPIGGVVNLSLVLSPEIATRVASYAVVSGVVTHWEAEPDPSEVLEDLPPAAPDIVDTAPVSDIGRRNIAAAFARRAS